MARYIRREKIELARPKKYKKICAEPNCRQFMPAGNMDSEDAGAVNLTLEEYEAIRLIDYGNLDQVEAAEKMEVARSTIQRIYKEAREKLADALVNGKAIRIGGGQYKLCDDPSTPETCPACMGRIRRGCQHK